MKNKFWERVKKCKHRHLSRNYSVDVTCPTPWCTGYEEHCLDCGVYITKCGCGYQNGKYGWPYKRREKALHKKMLKKHLEAENLENTK